VDRLRLQVNMDAVWAEEVLRDRPDLGPEDAYRLTLLATGSEGQADRARCDVLGRRLRVEP
jgi:hypothetical protein